MGKKDYYKILNVDPKASTKAIKSAYRQMALKYHPDHNPNNPQAKKQFALIREAYETLTSPELKSDYDLSYQPSVTRPSVQRKKTTTTNSKTKNNLRYNLYIHLEDVLSGCERSIRYVRKVKGTSETLQIKVKVPQGAFHHQRLKIAGFGDQIGNQTGDLFVIVHLQSHPLFMQEGLDLRVNVPICYLDILLGSTIDVPTLSGIYKLKLKSFEFDQLNFKVQGQGLPDYDSKSRGNLHVFCFVEHPKRISQAEKNALQKCLRTWPQGEMMREYSSYLKQHRRS